MSVKIGQIDGWVFILVLVLTSRPKIDDKYQSCGCEPTFRGRSCGPVGRGGVKHGQNGVEAGSVDKYELLCRTWPTLQAVFQTVEIQNCGGLWGVAIFSLRHRTTSMEVREIHPGVQLGLVTMITKR